MDLIYLCTIDLAGIVKHVTVIQRSELRADTVLQERLYSLPNVMVLINSVTKEITGTDKVNGVTYIDKVSGEVRHVAVEGVFVQIGLLPNTEFLQGTLELNANNEIIVDKHVQQVCRVYLQQVTAQIQHINKS